MPCCGSGASQTNHHSLPRAQSPARHQCPAHMSAREPRRKRANSMADHGASSPPTAQALPDGVWQTVFGHFTENRCASSRVGQGDRACEELSRPLTTYPWLGLRSGRAQGREQGVARRQAGPGALAGPQREAPAGAGVPPRLPFFPPPRRCRRDFFGCALVCRRWADIVRNSKTLESIGFVWDKTPSFSSTRRWVGLQRSVPACAMSAALAQLCWPLDHAPLFAWNPVLL